MAAANFSLITFHFSFLFCTFELSLEVLGQAKRTSSSSHVRKFSNKFGILLTYS